MIIYNSDLKIFYSTLINDAQFFSGFSTRDLGDAKNIDNIINYFNQQEVSFNKIVVMEQIHSINVEVLRDLSNGKTILKLEDTDGVITDKSGVVLNVRNADCVPIVFVDKSTGLCGISHQGWRGSLKKLATKMVDTFLSLGSRPQDLTCAIGPAIGACCYDIDDELYFDFLDEFTAISDKIFLKKKGRWHLSLSLLNYLQLVKAGVGKEKIDFFPFCTKCDRKHFYSRRRLQRHDFKRMFNFVMKIK